MNFSHAIFFHGYAEGPDKIWLPWLHRELESRDVRINAPQLPDPLRPNGAKWLRVALPLVEKATERTVIVGHSLGGVLALRALAATRRRVRAVILVGSPYASMINVDAMTSFFGKKIKWEKLREQAERFIVVHAKNDPLVPPDHALRYAETLGAELHIEKSGAHFTGKTAPLVLKIINSLSS